MQPLISIDTHTHITLLSITIAPGTFIAALTLSFGFLYSYLVSTGHIPLSPTPTIRFPRFATPPTNIVTTDQLEIEEVQEVHLQKELPALPPPDRLTDNKPAHTQSLRSLFSRSKAPLHPSGVSKVSLSAYHYILGPERAGISCGIIHRILLFRLYWDPN
ncbi:hypothetical protein F4778DRAFT_469528 [Xylariomycetidae sp. FL2044]|nr:hypothetical protein F4778DRAFT_469528 [Xylariomycetidae sp. FL2044]